MCGNFDPTPGEADVNALHPASFTAGYAQNLWIGALEGDSGVDARCVVV
jgi:hypothetical protein